MERLTRTPALPWLDANAEKNTMALRALLTRRLPRRLAWLRELPAIEALVATEPGPVSKLMPGLSKAA